VGDQRHAPPALILGKGPSAHCSRGGFGPRVGLKWCGISRPHRGFQSRMIQPLANSYAGYDIPATISTQTQH